MFLLYIISSPLLVFLKKTSCLIYLSWLRYISQKVQKGMITSIHCNVIFADYCSWILFTVNNNYSPLIKIPLLELFTVYNNNNNNNNNNNLPLIKTFTVYSIIWR